MIKTHMSVLRGGTAYAAITHTRRDICIPAKLAPKRGPEMLEAIREEADMIRAYKAAGISMEYAL